MTQTVQTQNKRQSQSLPQKAEQVRQRAGSEPSSSQGAPSSFPPPRCFSFMKPARYTWLFHELVLCRECVTHVLTPPHPPVFKDHLISVPHSHRSHPTESLTKPFVSGAVWYKMTFLVKTSPMEGYGKSKQEWKIILTWLSGNESCPISGESKRITVWPTSNPIRCWKFLFHTTQRNLPSGGGCTGQDSSREKERNSLSDGCLN